jgi:hypothetical protein
MFSQFSHLSSISVNSDHDELGIGSSSQATDFHSFQGADELPEENHLSVNDNEQVKTRSGIWSYFDKSPDFVTTRGVTCKYCLKGFIYNMQSTGTITS